MTELTTPSQTVGPFFAFGLCMLPTHLLVPEGSDGAIRVSGRVLDGAGAGVPDAMVEIAQADASGGRTPGFGWGRSGTDADGGYAFVTVKPGPVETAGLLQAPHLVVLVFARGLLKAVATRMYFPDEPEANAADPVLQGLPDAARATLVASAADGGYAFDVRLQGDGQTTFFAL